MPKPIFVLNGPNLNLLGAREPHVYGSATLADVEAACARAGERLGYAVSFRQSNHEGVLVDWLNEAAEHASAVVLNPAALGHTSLALHDALKAMTTPVVECHLSNPAARETFRHHSFTAPAAKGVISGFGLFSYVLALEAAARLAADARNV